MHSTRCRRADGNTMIELPLLLATLLVLFVFPLIDLCCLACGAACGYLMSQQAAKVAAVQESYPDALAQMSSTAQNFYGSGISRAWNMVPVGGYQGCGADLFVNATNYRGGSSVIYGPDKPMPGVVDPTSYIYEYSVHTQVRIAPMINLHGVPVLGAVPGLGQPALLGFSVSRMVEHPFQMCALASGGGTGGGSGTSGWGWVGAFGGTGTGTGTGGGDGTINNGSTSGWNDKSYPGSRAP